MEIVSHPLYPPFLLLQNGLNSVLVLGVNSNFNIIKYSWATSRVKWLSDEKTNISRTISVLVFRVLMYLENQSAPGIGLPEFHTHVGARPMPGTD
jgi:hypothetical protein